MTILDRKSFLKSQSSVRPGAKQGLGVKRMAGESQMPKMPGMARPMQNQEAPPPVVIRKPLGDQLAPKREETQDKTIFSGSKEISKYQMIQRFKNDKDVKILALKQGIPIWEMAKKLVEETYPSKYGSGLSKSEAKLEAKKDYWDIKKELRQKVGKPKEYKEVKKRQERDNLLISKTGKKPY